MSAEVGPREKINGRWSALAWCESCGDGIRNARARVLEEWADRHNAARHRDEVERILAEARAQAVGNRA